MHRRAFPPLFLALALTMAACADDGGPIQSSGDDPAPTRRALTSAAAPISPLLAELPASGARAAVVAPGALRQLRLFEQTLGHADAPRVADADNTGLGDHVTTL